MFQRTFPPAYRFAPSFQWNDKKPEQSGLEVDRGGARERRWDVEDELGGAAGLAVEKDFGGRPLGEAVVGAAEVRHVDGDFRAVGLVVEHRRATRDGVVVVLNLRGAKLRRPGAAGVGEVIGPGVAGPLDERRTQIDVAGAGGLLDRDSHCVDFTVTQVFAHGLHDLQPVRR